MVPGDNLADNMISVMKRQVCRLDLLGDGATKSPGAEHRDVLAAMYVLRCPGIDAVLESVAANRKAVACFRPVHQGMRSIGCPGSEHL